ncbi:PfkB family carbohydrate kinase [Parasphingorhabdus pacifica]
MKLTIIGDAVLDVDLTGSASRLCPDAPVPVVDVAARVRRPGGAALAALLAARQGVDVTVVTGRGADADGGELGRLLSGQVTLIDAPFIGGTPAKIRVRASGQSLLRLDSGDGAVPDVPLGDETRAAIRDADTVLVADYGRGITRNAWLRGELTALGPGTPLVWDPHPKGAVPVARADLVVPNRSEAGVLDEVSSPVVAAEVLRQRWGCGAVAVTLGADGAVVVPAREHVPAPEVPPGSDVCGAGDSFAVAAAKALGNRESIVDCVRYAVDSSSRFVAGGGVECWDTDRTSHSVRTHPLSAFEVAARVRAEGGRVVAAGGCFDLLHPGHVDLLERARALGDVLVVCLNSDESVRGLKGPSRPVAGAEDRRKLLEALECVDAVAVFDELSPCELLAELRPDVWVKGGEYKPSELPEARVVRRHGGRTVLLPLLDGYSSTRLLDSAQAVG